MAGFSARHFFLILTTEYTENTERIINEKIKVNHNVFFDTENTELT